MKRIFVVISNVLVCCFLIWVLTIISSTVVSRYYPFVAVRGNASGIQYEKVAKKLTKLANETDSLIAIQHFEPGSKGDSVVSYNRFGRGKLPSGLIEKKETEQVRSVESNYFIFRGKLTIERLREELRQLGLTRLSVVKPFILGSLAAIFGNGFQLLSLSIFLLSFAALSVISQIRALRSAGIRLISGERRWNIFTDPIKEDLLSCLLGMILSLLGAVFATFAFSFPFVALHIMVVGILTYNLLLLGISFSFCTLFAIGIKKVHLMQVIKGQIPVRGIISLILIGQLVAVVIVSFGINRAFVYSEAWNQQVKGKQAWAQETRLVQLSRSRDGLNIERSKQIDPKEWRWFQFIKEAVTKHDALLVEHNLVHRALQRPSAMHSEWQDYSPEGNVLFVTPNYLQKQKVRLNPTVKEKINNLQQGEFALLLPQNLKAEQKKYVALYEKYISDKASSPEGKRQQMKAIVSYLPSGKERFVYNTTSLSYQQYLKDPIIVVLTPQSTGDQAYAFWSSALQNYLLLNGVKETQDLLQKHHISHWTSELNLARQMHHRLTERLQIEVWTTIAGTVLGIVTSILLFNTMNLLYFEEFRRDIFIKQVSGFTFWELHRSYLVAQLLVFLIGLLASLLLTQSIWLSFIVFLLFTGNSIVLLQLQMKKESKTSTIILKGA